MINDVIDYTENCRAAMLRVVTIAVYSEDGRRLPAS